jgi:putative ABC transport system permease protein
MEDFAECAASKVLSADNRRKEAVGGGGLTVAAICPSDVAGAGCGDKMSPRVICSKLLAFLRGRRDLHGLNEEISTHLAMEIEAAKAKHADPADVRKRFGNPTLIAESAYETWRFRALEDFGRDVRHATRSMSPALAAAIVVTFALGIGMNTTVFSVANALVLKPLPYPDASKLVWLANFSLRAGRDVFTPNAEYVSWKEQSRSFDRMAGYGDDDVAMVGGGMTTQERICFITGDFWSITGAQASFGRLFGDGEAGELVLSWPSFHRRFGGDPRVIGSDVMLNGHDFRIAGVLPQDFRFALPQQYVPGDEVRGIDGYIAIPPAILALPNPTSAPVWEVAQQRWGPSTYAVYAVGRLGPGIPFERAEAEMRAMFARFKRSQAKPFYEQNQTLDFSLLGEKMSRAERRSLIVLLVAVAFVLLIACANIANLLIARAGSRRREIAIRAALGAGKVRLLSQVLSESVLLSLAGAVLGLMLARFCLGLLSGVILSGGRVLGVVTIDARVLWFTLAVALITGLLAGAAPAFTLWRADIHELMKSGGGVISGGSQRLRGRGALVSAEIGLAIILVAGAGLMLKSLWRMSEKPPGFAPEKILTMRITLSGERYLAWPPRQAYTEDLLGRLQALPGVTSAGIEGGSLTTSLRIGNSEEVGAVIRAVSPNYLRAIGVPLVEGDWSQDGSLFGVVVNESFAHQAGGKVVGRRLGGSILNDTIIGVVSDFKARQMDAAPLPEVYIPYQRFPSNRSMRVLVRSSSLADAQARAVQQVLAEVDATQPAYEFGTLAQALADSVAPRRFQLELLAVFAAAAVLLALIGIHGVMAWSAGQRAREICLRMALGAGRRQVVMLIFRQGMRLCLTGVVAGLFAAAGLTRLMASMLYDVRPNDTVTFSWVTGGMIAIALAACITPALQAASVDPAVMLRTD